MADSKEMMKDAFSQFVDTLMEKEIGSIKDDISSKNEEIRFDLKDLTKSVAEELEGIRSDTSVSIDQLEDTIKEINESFTKSFDELNESVSERIDNLDNTLRSVITDFSNQIFDRMTQQFSELNASIESLSGRVHHNEEILHNTRDNHGKISMLLNNFASSISSVSPEVAPPTTMPPQQNNVVTDNTPVQENKQNSELSEPVEVVNQETSEDNLAQTEGAKSAIPATIDETTGQYIYNPELEGHDEEFDGFKKEGDENEVVLDIGDLDKK